MSEYKLTIVIPTFNRPALLPRALASALEQTVQAKIIIADDGDIAVTADLLKGECPTELLTGQVEHLCTGADNAWSNWKAGYEAAETPYVTVLQDDDIVHPCYAERIIAGFDAHPDADVWLARLQCGAGHGMGLWYAGVGPWVPMDLQRGGEYCFHEGSILASTALFISWSLSPGIAYRNTPHFQGCLDRHPTHCDIFVERLLPAMVAVGGPFIAEPMICGYWMQHADQLSRHQHPIQPEHTKRFLPALDELLDRLPTWEQSLFDWCQLIPANLIIQWLGHIDQTCTEGGGSRHKDKVKSILLVSVNNRVQFGGERRWWKRAANWVRSRAAL